MSPSATPLTSLPLWEPAFAGAPKASGTGRHPAGRHGGEDVAVDWAMVETLKRQATGDITSQLSARADDERRSFEPQDRELLGRSVVRQVVREHGRSLQADGSALWTLADEDAYTNAVHAAIFGYGRLQPLFEIPDAENIEINGYDHVRVQYGNGRRLAVPPVAGSDAELIEAVRFLGEAAEPSRPFDNAHPSMTLALGDRFRVHAIGFGLCHRPAITIRQHLLTDVSLDDLARSGMFPTRLAELLHAAVLARKSIVVSGDQGAGKTTLLRALISSIPLSERFSTLETDYELLTHLQPGRGGVVALQARIGMGEHLDGHRVGEVSVADLIPEALRQNLTRLVVGEVRGAEAGAMFEAMQAGTGTMSTTHSHDAASTVDRLAGRVAQGGVLRIDEAYRQIAHHVHLVVYVRLTDDTWRGGRRRRYVEEVRYVTGGFENDRPVTHIVYRCDAAGREYFDEDPSLEQELAPFRPENDR